MPFPILPSNGSGAYNLTKSLRFRSSATAYLSWTPASAGNRTTWTWSAWIKKGVLGASYERLFGGPANACHVYFNSDYLQFDLSDIGSGTATGSIETSAIYRDPSAWYHIVAVCDTTQATSSNRMKLYVNGSLITALQLSTYPSQNYASAINSAGQHTLGYRTATQGTAGIPFDGYMAEVNFIDGQALTPSSFGANNAQTGVWQPIKYTGSYGTNGFYLPFTNTTSTTTLGYDFSGNSNNWTTNNFSLTAGTTYDSMTDVPTLTSATTANYAVINPLSSGTSITTNGNLTYSSNANSGFGSFGVSSGKWYWEYTLSSLFGTTYAGVCDSTLNQSPSIGGAWGGNVATYRSNGQKYNGSSTSYGSSFTTGDVIGTALDMDSGTITFYKNGVSQGVAFTGLNVTPYFPFFYGQSGGTTTYNVNFGQQPFTYTPPTGFVALNTYNLPTPTIGATASTLASSNMSVALYTGTGSNQTISTGFNPGLWWIKSRSAATNNRLYNEINTSEYLISNSTSAATSSGTVAQTTGGFIVGTDSDVNNNGSTYVAWNWKANGSGVSNTSGSITSTVDVNATAGFSIVTYTSTTGTVGHGLGVAPAMIIMKARNNTDQWTVGHQSLNGGSSPWNYGLPLNDTATLQTNSGFWNNTAPTSSVFSQGSWDSGNTKVAYCWTAIPGFSAFGSYTGNGSSDGPFIYTGFRPRYLMIKLSANQTNASSWAILDTARSPYNLSDNYLLANTSDAEGVDANYVALDILSNGFKIRSINTYGINQSSATYIYAAFAENPFKYANAR